MSEKILKALMQLFAIIARPESNSQDRRSVVESFLKRELNQELVNEYIKIFDHYYQEQQEKQKKAEKKLKKEHQRISSISVRVLRICNEINEELTQQQKVIVLFQLLEFARSDGDVVTEQELEFIRTVADSFMFPDEEYEELQHFVLNAP